MNEKTRAGEKADLIAEYFGLIQRELCDSKNIDEALLKINELNRFLSSNRKLLGLFDHSGFEEVEKILNGIFFGTVQDLISQANAEGNEKILKKLLDAEKRFIKTFEAILKSRDLAGLGKKGRILSVDLLDKSGRKSRIFRTWDPLYIKIRYRLNDKKDSAIGVAIHTENGIFLYGPNTGSIRGNLKRSGTAVLKIESLPLLTGTYLLSVTLTNRHSTHVFECKWKSYAFSVFKGNAPGDYGILSIPAKWEI
ncbi:MAG: Wzt carbohydrate-binding domain-containing protein [Candidatus Woesearchaeota archaeon]|nr:Wzt carbohydrate-binding domain-containing protein [Candidatus Woesearchaeota archaeon]